MKIRMTGTLAISLLLLVLGCSSVHVASEKEFYCSRNCAFVVIPEGDDPLHIKQKIENLLMSKGFVTISEDLESIEVYMQRREQTATEKKEGSPSRSGEGRNSIYRLRFSYEHYFYEYYIFTDFSASLVNYMDGDVITSANFSQSTFGTKSVMSVLEDFVDKLTGLVKFTSPN